MFMYSCVLSSGIYRVITMARAMAQVQWHKHNGTSALAQAQWHKRNGTSAMAQAQWHKRNDKGALALFSRDGVNASILYSLVQ